MKKTKTQKGITLVALIITIVVLLILAVVAIGAVQDSNIIGHAQNAAAGYNQAKNTEEKLLGNYVNTIEENMPKGKEEGITIEKILNKAYSAENQGQMLVYHFNQEDGKTYINVNAYDITTGEKKGTQQREVNLTNEFETIINITVNGSKVQISSANALLTNEIGETGGYITENAMYFNIEEGRNYTAPDSEYIIVRDSAYDSIINN